MTPPPDENDRTLPSRGPGPEGGSGDRTLPAGDGGQTRPAGGGRTQPTDGDMTLPSTSGPVTAPGGTAPDGTAPGGTAPPVPVTSPPPTDLSGTNPAATDVAGGAAGGAAESMELAEGALIGDRFEVVRKLGEGGMGAVFHVRDRHVNGREKALKIIRPAFSRDDRFRDQFFAEIKSAEKFVSEYVNQARDSGQLGDGRLYMTMDLVDGRPLDGLLRTEGTLAVRHALEITRQALLALQSGHKHGFVHRDMKPSNVMLERRVAKTDENPYGVGVKVLDFGIAGHARDLEIGQQVGTPYYMSPEQVRGEPLDGRSDLFSTGVMLYELLAGGPPFTGRTIRDITSAVLEVDVQPLLRELEHIAKPVREIVKRALEKDREKRFQSADEFIRAIEKSPAYRPKVAAPGWVGAAMGAMVLALGGLGYHAITQQQSLAGQRQQVADLQALVRETEQTKEVLDSRVESLESSEENLQGQVNQLTSENKDRKSLAEYNLEVEKVKRAEQERDGYREQFEAAQARVDELEARDRQVSEPARQFASRWSDALRAADLRDYDRALGRLEDARALEPDLAAIGLSGFATVDALAEVFGTVRDFDPATGEWAGAVSPAVRLERLATLLDQLAAGREGLEQDLARIDARNQIFEEGAIAQSSLRLLYGQNGQGGVLDAITELVSGEAEGESRLIEAVLAMDSASDIGTVFADVKRVVEQQGRPDFGLDRAEALVAALEDQCLDAGGAIDLAQTRLTEPMTDWVDWLGDLRVGRSNELATRIAEFEVARRFALGQGVDRDLRKRLPQVQAGTAPTSDWVGVLTLLVDWREAGQRFGAEGPGERIYVSDLQGRLEPYQWELESSSPTEAVWVRYRFEDGSRDRKGNRTLTWSDEVVAVDGNELFDLSTAPRDAKLVRWSPTAGADVLADLSGKLRGEAESFLAGPPIVALQFEDGDGEPLLWSPEVGLLRYRRGAFTYTLISR